MTPRRRRPEPPASFPRPSDEWTSEGLCASHPNPDLWFHEADKIDTKAARLICNECPVRKQCAIYPDSIPSHVVGIWGGFSQIQRERGEHRTGEPVKVPPPKTEQANWLDELLLNDQFARLYRHGVQQQWLSD